MKLACPHCGAILTGLDVPTPTPIPCAACGAWIPRDPPEPTAPETLPDLATRAHQDIDGAARQAATTLFQPGLMVRSILEEEAEQADDLEHSESAVAQQSERKAQSQHEDQAQHEHQAQHKHQIRAVGTRVVHPIPPPASPLDLETRPYFLVLGAPPGKERIALTTARTTFGRDRADVVLADDAVSAPHFQVDAMGDEFFVRDLQSRNGTLLNGHSVRYSELLPGDELQVGETVLVFRTANDGLSRRPS